MMYSFSRFPTTSSLALTLFNWASQRFNMTLRTVKNIVSRLGGRCVRSQRSQHFPLTPLRTTRTMMTFVMVGSYVAFRNVRDNVYDGGCVLLRGRSGGRRGETVSWF